MSSVNGLLGASRENSAKDVPCDEGKPKKRHPRLPAAPLKEMTNTLEADLPQLPPLIIPTQNIVFPQTAHETSCGEPYTTNTSYTFVSHKTQKYIVNGPEWFSEYPNEASSTSYDYFLDGYQPYSSAPISTKRGRFRWARENTEALIDGVISSNIRPSTASGAGQKEQALWRTLHKSLDWGDQPVPTLRQCKARHVAYVKKIGRLMEMEKSGNWQNKRSGRQSSDWETELMDRLGFHLHGDEYLRVTQTQAERVADRLKRKRTSSPRAVNPPNCRRQSSTTDVSEECDQKPSSPWTYNQIATAAAHARHEDPKTPPPGRKVRSQMQTASSNTSERSVTCSSGTFDPKCEKPAHMHVHVPLPQEWLHQVPTNPIGQDTSSGIHQQSFPLPTDYATNNTYSHVAHAHTKNEQYVPHLSFDTTCTSTRDTTFSSGNDDKQHGCTPYYCGFLDDMTYSTTHTNSYYIKSENVKCETTNETYPSSTTTSTKNDITEMHSVPAPSYHHSDVPHLPLMKEEPAAELAIGVGSWGVSQIDPEIAAYVEGILGYDVWCDMIVDETIGAPAF
eukprot:comp6497_c0_seq1/m.2269 comp6497_c0_seq1/g.2269  ORF comp6497_c0_seq1/g.2269 comp6497_c0_seq1/m.2269 type:complete len:562 (-) comp6497_c0_seq1:430-2115(-)